MMATLPAMHALDEAPGVVASVARIDAWMEVAKAGDRFVYATRMCLPAASKGAKRMLALAESGLVCLTRPRSQAEPTLFHYMATRTSKACILTRPERPKLVAPSAVIADGEAEAVNKLLPVLERFASARRPCPTDRGLAERAGLSEAAIRPTLDAMVQAHLILVQGVRPPTSRRIVIVSTGAATGVAV